MALAVLLVLASPAYPQSSMSDLAADEEGNLLSPRPPDYQVDENGTLIIEGDMLVPCSEVGGPPDPSETRNAAPKVRAEIEQSRREGIRACQAAGFDTAAGSSYGGAPASVASASALPETGGSASPVDALVPLALLVGVLLALGVARTDF